MCEIVGMQPITPIPESPAYARGINKRGKIIPVIDAHLKFGKVETTYDDRTCIIVIDIVDTSIGLIVDMVSEVLAIEHGNIVPPPSAKTGAFNRYINGIGKVGNDVKLLLDCSKIFNDRASLISACTHHEHTARSNTLYRCLLPSKKNL